MIVLAEQNLDFVLFLSDLIYILEKGRIEYTGIPNDLRANPDIQAKYLTL
jgi:branched-chain amino acid transport system ATP-binding protein